MLVIQQRERGAAGAAINNAQLEKATRFWETTTRSVVGAYISVSGSEVFTVELSTVDCLP